MFLLRKRNLQTNQSLAKRYLRIKGKMLLLDIVKEELKIKTQHFDVLRKSVEQTNQMSNSDSIGDSIKEGLTMFANAFKVFGNHHKDPVYKKYY